MDLNRNTNNGSDAITRVKDMLQSNGFEVENKKAKDQTFSYDLLANGSIRIEVMGGSRGSDGSYRFALTDKASIGLVTSPNRIKLPSGRFRKLFSKTADFIIAVGLTEDLYWIIPTKDIPDTQTMLNLRNTNASKYYHYMNAWKTLK